jgi:beta-glucosidase
MAAGKDADVSLTVDPRLLATFDVRTKTWKVLPDAYRVIVGQSAIDGAVAVTVNLDARTLVVGSQ